MSEQESLLIAPGVLVDRDVVDSEGLALHLDVDVVLYKLLFPEACHFEQPELFLLPLPEPLVIVIKYLKLL